MAGRERMTFISLFILSYLLPFISSIDFDVMTQPPLLLDARETRRYLRDESPHAPLYRGMGTHFVYIWVGTPSQRVSVIVDTGSHFTAFPCKGCNNCGTHTDNYWDPKQSSTSKIPLCNGQTCKFSQSYTEGSSWQAYKVTDIIWIGGERADMLEKQVTYPVNFTFGCQTSETGLFRTQVENGIMGLSSDPNTLPHALREHKILPSSVFSLCLLGHGGIMSIGSKNNDLNLTPMRYAQLLHKTGYYTVYLENILLKGKDSDSPVDIGEPKSKYNTGKGIIIDSGTTDSYLPSSIALSFRKTFQKITGILPSNSPISLTEQQFHSLPIIIYRVTTAKDIADISSTEKSSSSSSTLDIEFPAKNYMELQRDGKYVMRLYLTEGSGGVIGANMMIGHNIVFETEKLRAGIAKSECKRNGEPIYDQTTKPKKLH